MPQGRDLVVSVRNRDLSAKQPPSFVNCGYSNHLLALLSGGALRRALLHQPLHQHREGQVSSPKTPGRKNPLPMGIFVLQRTLLNPSPRFRMAEVTSSSLVGSTLELVVLQVKREAKLKALDPLQGLVQQLCSNPYGLLRSLPTIRSLRAPQVGKTQQAVIVISEIYRTICFRAVPHNTSWMGALESHVLQRKYTKTLARGVL
jgi:hypothetical protein